MTTTRRLGREAVLWLGGALGALCLLSLLAGWLFNVTPLVFSSGSMSPAYEAGALGLAHEVPAADLDVGDVVSVVNAEGDRVTHRIVETAPGGDGAVLTLQGDTNNVPDAESYAVTSAERVAFGVPYAGYVLNAAASPFGLLVIALLVGSSIWLGFGRREGSEGATPGPLRVLVPTGIAGVVLAGTALGATGQAPWAFTSAFWTDTATATATASTPAATDTVAPTFTSFDPAQGDSNADWSAIDCDGATTNRLCAVVTDLTASGADVESDVQTVTVKVVRTRAGVQACWDGSAWNTTLTTANCNRATAPTSGSAPQKTATWRTTVAITDTNMEGANAGAFTATFTATDVAGNVGTGSVAFRTDTGGPAFVEFDPDDGQSENNWTDMDCNNAVGATERLCVDITDAASGVATVTYRLVRTTGTDACWNGTAFVTPATAAACTLSMSLADGTAANGTWWSAVIPSSQMESNSQDLDYQWVITAVDAGGVSTTSTTIDFEVQD